MNFDLQLFADTTSGFMVRYSNSTVNIGEGNTLTGVSLGNGSYMAFNVNGSALDTVAVGASKSDLGTFTFALGNKSGVSGKIASATSLGLGTDASLYTFNIKDSNLAQVSLNSATGVNFIISEAIGTGISFLGEVKNDSIHFANANAKKILLAKDKTTIDSSSGLTLSNGDGSFVLTGSGKAAVSNVTVSSGSTGTIKVITKGTDTLSFADASVAVAVSLAGGKKLTSTVIGGSQAISFSSKDESSGTSLVTTLKDATQVKFTGSTSSDTVVVSNSDNDSKMTIIGGGTATDHLTLSGKGVENIVLYDGTTSGSYVATNFKENKGDIADGGNIISIGDSVKAISLTGSANAGKATLKSAKGAIDITSSEVSKNEFGVILKGSDTTVSALLLGDGSSSKVLSASSGLALDSFGLIVGDNTTKTLNLGDVTNKKVVCLSNAIGGNSWEDTAAYVDVTTVKASSVGGSMLVNGTDVSASLVGAGKNDSIWSGRNGITDTLASSTAKYSTNFYTGSGDGRDVITTISAVNIGSKSNADVLHFLDGVGYMKASDGQIVMGFDANNNFTVNDTAYSATAGGSKATSVAGGMKVAYNFGLDSDEVYVLSADISASGDTLQYTGDENWFLGKSASSGAVSVTSAAGVAKTNWDGGAGTTNIKSIDGSAAAEGSILFGNANTAQSVTGSSVAGSSISGGTYDATNWLDGGKDTLIGGNTDSASTTFIVGANMGADKIKNLSSGDNIVFMNSKFEESTFTQKSATASKFSLAWNGTEITAETADGSDLSKVKDLTVTFDDAIYTWNGEGWVGQARS